VLAVALIVMSATTLLVMGLFRVLPMLLRRGAWAEGELGFAVMIVSGLAETSLTLVASIALLRNRGWARGWIVCASFATFIPLALYVLRMRAFPFWPYDPEDFDNPVAPVLFAGTSAWLALSVAALALLLVYDRQELGRVRRRAWVSSATAVLLLVGTGWLTGPIGREYLERLRIAVTPVAVGSGTGVVMLLYDGAPLQEPNGVMAYVTLEETTTKWQTRTAVPLENGSIFLPRLGIGDYAVRVVVDANQNHELRRRRGPRAADYEGHNGRLSLLRDGDVARGQVNMVRVLRLLRPDDTETGVAPSACARVTSPVEFEWEPVPRAVGYSCFVTRRRKEGDDWQREYADSSWGIAPTCRTILPRNTLASVYEINIQAVGKTGVITRFEDSRSGWAPEYCFVVE
jgi:hypothetical protein